MALADRTIGAPQPSVALRGLLKMAWLGGFPGGLVVRIRCFHCRDPGSGPRRGTMLLVTWQGQKYQKKKIDGVESHNAVAGKSPVASSRPRRISGLSWDSWFWRGRDSSGGPGAEKSLPTPRVTGESPKSEPFFLKPFIPLHLPSPFPSLGGSLPLQPA